MIAITGAAGFIASCLIAKLNAEGFSNLILVDDFSSASKLPNYQNKKYVKLVDRNIFISLLEKNEERIDFIFHLGAKTDTTLFDTQIFDELNVRYTQAIFKACTRHNIGIVYASSAATYGLGEHGYVDKHDSIPLLKPLNPYGWSKQQVDEWVLAQAEKPYYWAGVKFFNVYGPNEYHKGRMASVIMHAYQQIKETGKVKLFKSHNADYADGGQLRDFIYVKDVVSVLYHFMHYRKKPGIYNLGTGKAESFNTLALSVFKALDKAPQIEYIDTPMDIREKYQYYTQARIDKLRAALYLQPFHTLEQGAIDYVKNYLYSHLYL